MQGHPVHGLIARITRSFPIRPQPLEKRVFYRLKIAKLLFPENFVTVRAATSSRKAQIGYILSEEKRLDEPSKAFIAKFLSGDCGPARIEKIMATREYKSHLERVEKIADPIIVKLARKGLYVNDHPFNIFFDVNGNPVFFDIKGINPKLVLESCPP